MTKRTWLLIGLGTVLAGLLTGWAWQTMTIHAAVVAGIPRRPSLDRWPVEFKQRVGRCERAGLAGSVPALVELGRLYHANGFTNGAIQCYQSLVRVDPANPRWPHLLASLLAGYGRIDEALPLEQRAIVRAPDYMPARLLLAQTLLKTNLEAEARRVYAAALTRDKSNVYALRGLAMCEVAKNDWPAARNHLLQALAAKPQFEGALTLLVTVYEHLGDSAAAESTQMQADEAGRFQDFSDEWSDSLTGDCYDSYRLSVAAASAGAAGDGVTAKRWLERAVALAPDQDWTHRLLGQLLDQLHDYAAAHRELARALELDSTEPRNWSQLATLQLHEGKIGEAVITLAAGVAHCSSDGNLHYERGALLMDQGRLDAAIDELRQAKRLKPDKSAAYVDLARIYVEQGRETEAVAELHAILVIEPEHPFALLTLARNAVRIGDEADARLWLDRVRHQPRVPADSVARLLAAYQESFGHAPPSAIEVSRAY